MAGAEVERLAERLAQTVEHDHRAAARLAAGRADGKSRLAGQ